ncbi:unnamed protein product [Ambrosiozyma monospora]|uniref:Choline monooxygenase, chloroplastic n=1 Tax=Ambrosiozyma monospora TaxID=43982 RepID=A0A9W6YRB5_AMBMO|nr:unnamed protein product [Ambrosiozyma monospora]
MLSTLTNTIFKSGSLTNTEVASKAAPFSPPKLVKQSDVPETLPVSWYTNDKVVGLAKAKLFDQGWHFITIVGAFHEDQANQNGLEGGLQFEFIGNAFFGLCTVDDVESVKEIEMYYGDFKSVTEGCETIEERINRCRSGNLKKVRHVVTDNGLVFVTHNPDECEMWDYFGGELQQFVSGEKANCRNFPLRKRLVYECDYNFITFLDGYQECLHCKYTHPGLASMYPFESYKVDNHTNFSRHHCNPTDGYDLDDGLFL